MCGRPTKGAIMPTKVVIQLTEVEESKVLPNLLRHYPWYLFFFTPLK